MGPESKLRVAWLSKQSAVYGGDFVYYLGRGAYLLLFYFFVNEGMTRSFMRGKFMLI